MLLQVQSVKLIRNKQTGYSEGYGFVEFVSHAAAEKILQAYNGTQMPNTEQPFRLKWIAEGPPEAGPEHTISARAGNLRICDNDTVRLSDVFSHDHQGQRGGDGRSSRADKLLGCPSSSCNSVHDADAASELNEKDVWGLGIDGSPDFISAKGSVRAHPSDPRRSWQMAENGRLQPLLKRLVEGEKPRI
jgi:RNA recognition motif-containing protein